MNLRLPGRNVFLPVFMFKCFDLLGVIAKTGHMPKGSTHIYITPLYRLGGDLNL